MDTLRARKVRSGLTILGIVIGVTSVISVAAIIEGLNGMVSARVSKFGARTMFVMRIPAGSNPFQRLPEKIRLRKYLQSTTAISVEHCPGLAYATTFINRIDFAQTADSIRYGDAHVERFFLRGVEPDYLQALPLFSVAHGRFISDFDLEHARPVVVIGNAIAESLFPLIDPIGKTVRLNGRPFEVIGVFEVDPGLFGTPGVDQFAAIPISTFHKNYPEIKEIFIAVAGREGVPMSVAHDQVVEAMRRRRHVPYNKPDDFETADPNFFAELWNQLTGALVLLTGVISSIGLLVGGIGVMNIMLISVTERTKEIGIRKAIGARKADIRVQFLLEAVTLSGLGGMIGIVLGALIAFTIRTLIPDIPATLSLLWVTLGRSDFGGGRALFRILSRGSRGETGSYRMPAIRVITPADIPAAMRLKETAGWNQTEADWRNVLQLAPDGCFGIDVDGELAATTTAVHYGSELAWIGMVLTHPASSGQGPGAPADGARAEISGRPVRVDQAGCDGHGPSALSKARVRRREPDRALGKTRQFRISGARLQPRFRRHCKTWTEHAFGGDRSELLSVLGAIESTVTPRRVRDGPGGIEGDLLWPVRSGDSDEAQKLVGAFLARHADETVYWDLLPHNVEAVRIARESGFEPLRRLVRMARQGRDAFPHDDSLVYAIAGFEYG